ncbi:MAG: hypothetical protein K2X27_05170 [Candidatus Obscuribacterales bacterium]|nr:hypothetical protein [Candidatus Obscuribacterales bacterium]
MSSGGDNLKIAFVMLAYGERAQILQVYREIRRCYTRSLIVIRFDGDLENKDELACLREDKNLEILEEPELFPLEHGGKLAQRLLELMLSTAADYIVKVDPDTQIRRPLRILPDQDDLFIAGTVQNSSAFSSVQGGCIIFNRKTVEHIFNSRILESPELCPPDLAWLKGRNCKPSMYRSYILGLTSIDWCFGWAAQKLGIPLIDCPEVMSNWIFHHFSELLRYYRSSIVHPRLSVLSVFDPGNLKRRLAFNYRFEQWKPPARRSEFAMDFADYDAWSLPPGLIPGFWLPVNLSLQFLS